MSSEFHTYPDRPQENLDEFYDTQLQQLVRYGKIIPSAIFKDLVDWYAVLYANTASENPLLRDVLKPVVEQYQNASMGGQRGMIRFCTGRARQSLLDIRRLSNDPEASAEEIEKKRNERRNWVNQARAIRQSRW